MTGVAYSTLQGHFHGTQSRAATHGAQQLTTGAERAIVRWTYRLGLAGIPPRIEHMLNDDPDDLDQPIVKNWISRFLDRHPELVVKFSTFDKRASKLVTLRSKRSLSEGKGSYTKT